MQEQNPEEFETEQGDSCRKTIEMKINDLMISSKTER